MTRSTPPGSSRLTCVRGGAVDGRLHAIGKRETLMSGLRCAAIPMMKTTKHRRGNNITDRIDVADDGRVAIEREMSPRAVVVVDVLAQHAAQMIFAEGDDVVGALAADATDDALDEGVLPWRSPCADHLLDAEGLHSLAKGIAEDRVAITVEELGFFAARKRLDELVGSPCGRRVRGDVEVPAAPVMREHDEDVEDLEGQRRHREEVAGGSDGHVVGDERTPLLPIGFVAPPRGHVLRDGGRTHVVAEVQEFVRDARRAPEDVLPRELLDEVDHLHRDGRATDPSARSLSPVVGESVSMPADDRLGLHDDEMLSPVRKELPHEHPEDTVFILEFRSLYAPLQDVELLSKDGILHREPSTVCRDGAEEGGEMGEGFEHGEIMAS